MMTQGTAEVALGGFILFALLAFGLRAAVHYRRTGTTGFVGISGRIGSVEWFGGVLFIVALAAAVAAPVLQLAGRVDASPAFDGGWAMAAGIAFYLVGVAATLWAQLAMGESWRIGVDARERTALVASGPFRWVRNPIYTAMTIATIGLALLAPNPLSCIAVITLIVALQIQVRLVEEPYLRRIHGERYRRWAAQTGRFLPMIGRMA